MHGAKYQDTVLNKTIQSPLGTFYSNDIETSSNTSSLLLDLFARLLMQSGTFEVTKPLDTAFIWKVEKVPLGVGTGLRSDTFSS